MSNVCDLINKKGKLERVIQNCYGHSIAIPVQSKKGKISVRTFTLVHAEPFEGSNIYYKIYMEKK